MHQHKPKNITKLNNKQKKENLNNLKCLYTNADSLINKMEELQNYIKIYKPKLIAITEVKTKNNRVSLFKAEFQLEDYTLFDTNIEEKKGRGILIFIHSTLKARNINFHTIYNESCWIEIDLQNHDNLLVGCIYRSNSGTLENNENLLKLITEAINKKSSHVLILGDFNYPTINWEAHTSQANRHNEITFVDNIRKNSLFQHINQPTRGRINQTPHILDLIFTNEEQMISEILYLSPLGKSDHNILIFNFNCYIKSPTYEKTLWFYNKTDYDSLKKDIRKENWEFKNISENINNGWNIFKKKLEKKREKYVPHKNVIEGKNNNKPPLDINIVNSIKKKHTLWKRYMETRNEKYYLEYCKVRNKVRKLTRRSRKKHEETISIQAKENPKVIWKYIKSKLKTKEIISELHTDPFDDKSKMAKTDKEKTEVLSAFFSSVFTVEPTDNIPILEKIIIKHAFTELIITEADVLKQLNDLNEDKSPGPDGINPKLIKNISNEIYKPIAHIFQQSLKTMNLPTDWKEAQISAIYKKGKKHLASNYRPVSLTSIICKCMEKIIRDHLIKYLDKNNLISEKQYGFIKGRSTTTQLLKALDQWTKSIDEGKTIDIIYLDFQKAFDTVPHKRLIEKIRAYGVKDPVLGWIKSFLENRKQYVQLRGSKSEWKNVTSGIPQGSVLGPILFIIYINDLPEVVNSNIYLFADDTKIYKSISTQADQEVLQSDIDNLSKWSETWLMKFHPEKCKILTLGKPPPRLVKAYEMSSQNQKHLLKRVDHETDLGVTFDQKLDFELHINNKVNKAIAIFAVIRRTYKYLNEKTFIPLYKALVRSHLDYAVSVWSPYKKKYRELIEKVQRRVTKQLPGFKDLPYEERLKTLKLPTLAYRRARGDMIEVFKITHNIYDPVSINGIISYSIDEISRAGGRGHSFKLYQQRAEKEIRRNTFGHRVVQIWNKLPNHVVNAQTLNSFKRRLDKHWRNQEIVYNYKAEINSNSKTTRPLDEEEEEEDSEEEDLAIEEENLRPVPP